MHVITFQSADVLDRQQEIQQRSVFIWSATIIATAVNRMHASIISASIPAPFRTFADTGPIAPRSIIARSVPVNLAAQVIRILDARRSSIASPTRSARPVRCATEVYAQRFAEVREIASAISSASMAFVSLLAEAISAARNINTAIITYVFKNYVARRTVTVDMTKSALKTISDRPSAVQLAI